MLTNASLRSFAVLLCNNFNSIQLICCARRRWDNKSYETTSAANHFEWEKTCLNGNGHQSLWIKRSIKQISTNLQMSVSGTLANTYTTSTIRVYWQRYRFEFFFWFPPRLPIYVCEQSSWDLFSIFVYLPRRLQSSNTWLWFWKWTIYEWTYFSFKHNYFYGNFVCLIISIYARN